MRTPGLTVRELVLLNQQTVDRDLKQVTQRKQVVHAREIFAVLPLVDRLRRREAEVVLKITDGETKLLTEFPDPFARCR